MKRLLSFTMVLVLSSCGSYEDDKPPDNGVVEKYRIDAYESSKATDDTLSGLWVSTSEINEDGVGYDGVISAQRNMRSIFRIEDFGDNTGTIDSCEADVGLIHFSLINNVMEFQKGDTFYRLELLDHENIEGIFHGEYLKLENIIVTTKGTVSMRKLSNSTAPFGVISTAPSDDNDNGRIGNHDISCLLEREGSEMLINATAPSSSNLIEIENRHQLLMSSDGYRSFLDLDIETELMNSEVKPSAFYSASGDASIDSVRISSDMYKKQAGGVIVNISALTLSGEFYGFTCTPCDSTNSEDSIDGFFSINLQELSTEEY